MIVNMISMAVCALWENDPPELDFKPFPAARIE